MTGNRGHLSKMLKIAQHRKNRMSRYHNALYLGDVEERVRVLEEVGQYALAYVTAATNGLEEDAQRLSKVLADSGATVPTLPTNPQLMMPPTPVQSAVQQPNWPEVEIERDVFAEAVKAAQESQSLEENPEEPGWEDENLDADMAGKGNKGGNGGDLDLNEEDGMDLNDDGGWGDDDDLGLGSDDDSDLGLGSSDEEGDVSNNASVDGNSGFFVPPNPGRADSDYWTDSPLAADHVAAGSFTTAMKLLNRQIGAINFVPMKNSFLSVSSASQVQLNGLPGTAPMGQHVLRNEQNGKNSLPRVSITLSGMISDYKAAKKMFGKNQLDESLIEMRK